MSLSPIQDKQDQIGDPHNMPVPIEKVKKKIKNAIVNFRENLENARILYYQDISKDKDQRLEECSEENKVILFMSFDQISRFYGLTSDVFDRLSREISRDIFKEICDQLKEIRSRDPLLNNAEISKRAHNFFLNQAIIDVIEQETKFLKVSSLSLLNLIEEKESIIGDTSSAPTYPPAQT